MSNLWHIYIQFWKHICLCTYMAMMCEADDVVGGVLAHVFKIVVCITILHKSYVICICTLVDMFVQ